MAAAENQATNMANPDCIGNAVSTVVLTRNVIRTGTSDNPNYMATVTVRGACQIETRR